MAAGRRKKESDTPKSSIQFHDRDSRLTFIQERLDSLLDEFGGSYGSFLAEELQKRLEYTIRVFHEDASELLMDMAKQSNAMMSMSDEIRQGRTIEDLVGASPEPIPAAAANPVKPAGTPPMGTDRVGMPKSLFQKKQE